MITSQDVSKRRLIVGITFAVGLVIGVLTVITVQSFVLKSEPEPYDLADIELQQNSTENFDRDSNLLSFGIGQFEEIFKLRSPVEQRKALYNILSSSTEQELKQ